MTKGRIRQATAFVGQTDRHYCFLYYNNKKERELAVSLYTRRSKSASSSSLTRSISSTINFPHFLYNTEQFLFSVICHSSVDSINKLAWIPEAFLDDQHYKIVISSALQTSPQNESKQEKNQTIFLQQFHVRIVVSPF